MTKNIYKILLFSLLFLSSSPLGAAKNGNAGKQLKEVERALKEGRDKRQQLKRKSAKLDENMKGLRREMVAAAKAIQTRESEAMRIEARLEELAVWESEKTERLKMGRVQFSRVLMALERLARHPPAALIVQPLTPSETVRGAILLRAAVPAIERRAGELRQDIAGITSSRRETAARRRELMSAMAAMEEQRTHLDVLLAKKVRLKHQTDERSRDASLRISNLARQAKDLRDLLARIEREGRERRERDKTLKEDLAPISKSKGALLYPAMGRLTILYGQSTGPGLTHKGITIETRPKAQVVAPYEGKVVFAGLFRGYGQLLIIEHGGGYHSLLAGLESIVGVVGQMVVSGEPIGVMPPSGKGTPALYVELRRNGRPINPLPWLAARKSKVSG